MKSTFMKAIRWSAVFVVTGGLVVPFVVQAHDPKEHLEDTESPNCVALRDMEEVKTDPNDPVMQAIMKQCMDELHHDDEDEVATEPGEQSEPAGSGAPHTDQPG